MFAIYEEELWPEEPSAREIMLDTEKVYRASLIWRRKGYESTELKEYYIEPKSTHAYFFHDRELKRCGGCYPLHWFTGFVEVTEEIDQISEEIVLEFEDNDHFYTEDVQEFNGYEQLSLF
ncbi:sugar ABC transporter [Cytobacillus firmus]|uniref:Sugar ABC transporter n=1 Tax=Cytobacillus firmus TaxID=1399 RepID=A0AA46PEW3_CYTFI|nr:sugar ABC transporter [Cytobacillus firmus]UYG93208.1 sugar ABC transporter [Cytobacillus firmus]